MRLTPNPKSKIPPFLPSLYFNTTTNFDKIKELRANKLHTRNSFINKHIFPGGYLPSITQLLNHISKESNGTLIVERVENIGGHYAKTLRLWRDRFLTNFESRIRPALKAEHPSMTQQEIDVFRRKWEVR